MSTRRMRLCFGSSTRPPSPTLRRTSMNRPYELSEGQRRIETMLDRLVVTYLPHARGTASATRPSERKREPALRELPEGGKRDPRRGCRLGCSADQPTHS